VDKTRGGRSEEVAFRRFVQVVITPLGPALRVVESLLLPGHRLSKMRLDARRRWRRLGGCFEVSSHLAQRAVATLLVATGGAGGADDDHASALAAVLVGRHVGGDGFGGRLSGGGSGGVRREACV